MLRKRLSTVAFVAACLLLVGACGSDEGDDGDDAAPAESDDSSVATTLRARFSADPTLIDPIYISNGADFATSGILFEALVQPSPEGDELVNVLAETWEVADDGMSIDFTLKPGVQFHGDYGEVTAEDVKFSLERAAGITPSDPEPFQVALYAALEGVEVTDTHSGTITLKEPSVTLLEQALPLAFITSKAAFDELGVEGFQEQPVGTGPYEFAEWVPGERVRFTNFEEYSGSAPYVPEERFEELVFQVIADDNAAELAYEAGDLDLLDPIRASSLSRFQGLDETEVTEGVTMRYRWIGMNVSDPALANEDLRNAIIAAIDVPSIIEATSEGEDLQARALVAPSSPIGHWEDAPEHERDVEEATQLVEGIPEDQRSLRITVADDETSRTIAQIAQQNLEEVGLQLEIETLDAASFFVTGEPLRQRQLFYTEFGINYREPTQELVWFTCDQFDVWNYMYWCDERYTELFAEAQRELDDEARHDMYIEMQERFEEGRHTVWISHPATFVAARTDVVDVVTDAAGSVYYQALAPQ